MISQTRHKCMHGFNLIFPRLSQNVKATGIRLYKLNSCRINRKNEIPGFLFSDCSEEGASLMLASIGKRPISALVRT